MRSLVKYTLLLVMVLGIITCLVGAYGGVLSPKNEFEFYSFVLFLSAASGVIVSALLVDDL